MDTTTLTAFWQGFTSTTIETILGNYHFFTDIGVIAIIMLIFSGLFYGFTYVFKERKWKKNSRNRY